MKVLITGATGFVGSWLVKTAPCDILTTDSRLDLSGDWTHIIHCGLDKRVLYNNYTIMKDVLDAASERDAPVILISSGAARFPGQEGYGYMKRKCEQMCYGHKATILRLYSFIGPGLQRFAPYEMLKQGIHGKDIVITGDGTTIRSYLYAQQMADEIWKKVDTPGRFEIGSNWPVTMLELARTVAEICDVGIQILGGPNGSYPIYIPEHGQKPMRLQDQLLLTIGDLHD